jgi:hypothetical protein
MKAHFDHKQNLVEFQKLEGGDTFLFFDKIHMKVRQQAMTLGGSPMVETSRQSEHAVRFCDGVIIKLTPDTKSFHATPMPTSPVFCVLRIGNNHGK